MNQINSFLSALKTAYSQQGQTGKILIPALFLFVFCCLCSILFSLFPRGSPSNAAPTPNIFPTQGTQLTPTALFDFDFPTLTPLPTLPPPTAFPTLTPPPTETQTLTPTAATATETPLPTFTPTPVPTTVTATIGPVVILAVHKTAENVDVQNIGPEQVDLRGWRLLSETGDQSCDLSGTLKPGEVLKVWANRGPGFDCRFPDEIWLDIGLDPAVLFNPQGLEVSRSP